MSFSLADAFAPLMHLFNNADAAAQQGTAGAFGTAYDIILGLISVNGNGVRILEVVEAPDGSKVIANIQTGEILNLDSAFAWTNEQKASFLPAAGVDLPAWTFLSGVSNVNRNDQSSLYNHFIREYTEAQYRLRFGNDISDEELHQRVQNASNNIARFILRDILSLDESNNPTSDNPNHELPTIAAIATRDAQAAANALFNVDGSHPEQIAGWAGNPFFPILGYNVPFLTNIFHPQDNFDTGDVFSVIDAMKTAAEKIGIASTGSLILDIATNIIPRAGDFPGLVNNILNLTSLVDTYLKTAYGLTDADGSLLFKTLPPSHTAVDLRDHGDTFVGTSGEDVIYAGKGNDSIVASADSDFIDGGQGFDTMSYASFVNGVDVKVADVDGALYQHRVVVDKTVSTKDLVYGIEKLIETDGMDTTRIAGSSLPGIAIDGGANADTVDYSGFTGGGITVTASFAGTTVQQVGQSGPSDTLTSIENLVLTSSNDTLNINPLSGLKSADGGDEIDTLRFTGGTLDDRNGVIYDNKGQQQLLALSDFENFENVIKNTVEWRVADPSISGPVSAASQGHIYNAAPFSATVTFTQVLGIFTPYNVQYQDESYGFVDDLVTEVQLSNGNLQFYGSDIHGVTGGAGTTFLGSEVGGPLTGDNVYNMQEVGSLPTGPYNSSSITLVTGIGNDEVNIPAASYRNVTITYKGGNDTFNNLFANHAYTTFNVLPDYVHLDSQITLSDVSWTAPATDTQTGITYVDLVIANKGTLTLTGNFGDGVSTGFDVVLDSGGMLHISNTGVSTSGSFTGTAPVNLTWGDDNYSVRGDINVGQTVYAYGGLNIITGGDYADTIIGGADEDTLDGGRGNDTIHGSEGDNWINVGDAAGDDIIYAGIGSGFNVVSFLQETFFVGHTTVYGAGGPVGATEIMLPTFGSGSQTLHISADTLAFDGKSGSITVHDVTTIMLGNDSTYVYFDETVPMSVFGGTGDNVYFGTEGVDFINGGSGDDEIYGYGGDDNLGVGSGFNYVEAGNGNDSIFVTGAGDSYFDGGEGFDRLQYNLNTDNTITVANNSFNSYVESVLTGLDTFTGIEAIWGGAGFDTIFGDATQSYELHGYFGNDTLHAGNMGDTLFGDGQNDTLFGGSGNDTLDGGSGTDVLQGGLGNDTYVYRDGPLVDSITDTGGSDTVLFGPAYAIQGLTITYVGTTMDILIDDHLYLSAANGTTTGRIETIAFSDGSSYDVVNNAYTFVGSEGNDTFTAGTGDDIAYGNGGNDTLSGGLGSDSVYGGDGNDTFLISTESGNNWDYFDGGHGSNVYQFTAASFLGLYEIHGGTDATDFDEIVLPTFNFGIPQDLYLGASYIQFDPHVSGNDYFTYLALENGLIEPTGVDSIVLGNDQTTVYLDEGDPLSSVVISGGTADNTYYGTSVVDQIHGGTGNDTVIGYDGDNILSGGAGNDTISGGTGNEMLDGGAGADTIYGIGGDDTLIGGTGNDVINSGPDNELYLFSDGDGQDTVTDAGGFDTISFDATVTVVSVVYSQNGNDLIIAYGTGTDAITVTGFFDTLTTAGQIEQVAFSDGTLHDGAYIIDQVNGGGGSGTTITGTAGDDVLTGGAADETLLGLGGNDTLDGGAGADTMLGGTGNDLYYVDNAGDVITETPGDGSDGVVSSVSYTLSANVESLTLTGSADLSGTGNGVVNILTGNSGNNSLDGKGGADTMTGGLGDDTYVVNNGSDAVIENTDAGTDTVRSSVTHTLAVNVENLVQTGTGNIKGFGNADNNSLSGNTGNNSLDGGLGADAMAGGLGNDTYFVDDAGDSVTESASEGTDTVKSAISYILGVNLENLTLTGTGNIDATGNDANNLILGNAGDNIIDGGAGADTMKGGLGNDTYYVDNSSDVVTDSGGIDTVFASASYTLGNGVENLTLVGDGEINGGGNGLANVLTGNNRSNVLTGSSGIDTISGMDGHDTLDGGGGADTIFGGHGDDTYIINSAAEILSEDGGNGHDTVQSSATWTLGSDFEDLILTGTNNIKGFGNADANVITGNTGNNSLDGGGGNDSLAGGLGDDTYIIGNTGVTVTENLGEGTDTVKSSISYTLGDNLDNLTLTGTAVIDGTGNELNNVITGNSVTNTLSGLGGNDTLTGGGAADRLQGGDDHDTLYGSGGADTLDGWNGDDILFGQGGADTLTGGLGADTFAFQAANAYGAVDKVTDFNTAEGDKLDFIDLLSAVYDPLTMQLSDFVQTTESGGNTTFSVDRDGLGTGFGFTNVVTLNGVTGLPDVDTMVANGNLAV